MLGTSKLMAFIATSNPREAQKFYGEVLELRELENTPFAILFDADGTNLRVQKVEASTPQPYTVLGWEVSDITNTVQQLTRKGVKFQHFDQLPQDEHGIWATPDGAKVAWFKDPDGNTLSVTQGRSTLR